MGHNPNPMWGGHFSQGPEEAFAEINPSIGFDQRLYAYDIEGSIAHCQMLMHAKIIEGKDAQEIIKGLNQVKKEIEDGQLMFEEALEDIHMNIEARLKDIIGDVAGRLHTARSRNDQVATDFRMFIRDAIDETGEQLKKLQTALLDQASSHVTTIMPGFTHLQPAQPIVFAHHLMAYVEMFGRDAARLKDVRKRVNECPLGAAALAGTSFPIDRKRTSMALSFREPMRNSIDAVSARDFALEFLSTLSICMIHLSRLAEELVLWTSPLVDFATLPEGFTSGSSIMPQKRNPDAAELIRGKTGRVLGALNSLMVTMKGLPLAYNKDTQEDKEPVFDAYEQIRLCIMAMTGMIDGLRAKPENMLRAASDGYSTATDLADWFVRECGMTFRDAHHAVGKLVRTAEERGVPLESLYFDDFKEVAPKVTDKVFKVLSVEASVASRKSQGGTAPVLVKEEIAFWRKMLEEKKAL